MDCWTTCLWVLKFGSVLKRFNQTSCIVMYFKLISMSFSTVFFALHGHDKDCLRFFCLSYWKYSWAIVFSWSVEMLEVCHLAMLKLLLQHAFCYQIFIFKSCIMEFQLPHEKYQTPGAIFSFLITIFK